MPRAKVKNSGLPPYTYQRASGYYYKPYCDDGSRRPTITLRGTNGRPMRPGCALSEVWVAWERLQEQPRDTLAWLLDRYLESEEFSELAGSSSKERTRQAGSLKRFGIKGSRSFGDIRLKQITPGVLRKYLKRRKADGAPVAGNRELELISVAWNLALGEDDISLPNPCTLVKRNKETPRTRYVTDDEYQVAYELAAGTRYLQPAMEIAYLCRMRAGEVRALSKADVLEEGLDTRRSKGSRDAVTLWTDRLHAAVRIARMLDGDSVYLLHNRDGQPLTKNGFDSALQRLKRRMGTVGIEPFNFHDLKAKGVSDFEGDKQAASGHKTPAMVVRYDRKKARVKATK